MPLVINGATSGSTTVQATDAVTATITLPSTTGTVQLSGTAGSFTDLTTTGNTILGNASTDTLNVGNGDLIKDASGNVGVGTGTPNAKLDVWGTPDVNFGSAFLFDNRTAAIDQGGVIAFGGYKTATTAQSIYGQIAGRKENATSGNEAGYLSFNTNNSTAYVECMRIASSGNVGIGVTPAGTGGCLQLKSGITFPATQSASTDANTLDDYEEGTWTPVIADSPTAGNVGTYSNQFAKYTKIGNIVSLQMYISAINTTGMTAGNTFYIRGLPFQPASYSQGSFYTYRVGRDAATVSSSASVNASSTSIQFPLFTVNSATVDKAILVSGMVSGTSEIQTTIVYTV